MKSLLLFAVVMSVSSFAFAYPKHDFLTCTSKSYTFIVIPKMEADVDIPYFEGVYMNGALVSYNRTDGIPVETLKTGQQVWSQNGGFTVTVEPIADIKKDLRREFTIVDDDGEEGKFPTEKGYCTGLLALAIPGEQ